MSEGSKIEPEKIFYDRIKERDYGDSHVYTEVSIFFKKTKKELKRDYTRREVIDMYVDIVYHNKKTNDSMPK